MRGMKRSNTVLHLGAWTVARVRAAEDALLGRVPESVLMRRAAFGVATRAAAVLAERTGGVTGRHVVLLVGAGNNGGDTLWAGAFLRRRGVAVTAVLLSPDRAHPQGLAALRRAGGRIAEQLPQRAHLVLDGIVGLAGRGALRGTGAAKRDWSWDVPVEVNGQLGEWIFDTGANISTITESLRI
jgi:ADP-dependent NAD(P)H-hydrate dehydratase / NAD(P)H-hydrate epimerase